MHTPIPIPIPTHHSPTQFHNTRINNLGKLQVLIFHVDWNEKSKKFITQLTSSIPVFGMFQNVHYFIVDAERLPIIFRRFGVEKTPAVLVLDWEGRIVGRCDGDQVGPVFDCLEPLSVKYKAQFDKQITIWSPKIQQTLSTHPLTIFLQGSPPSPTSSPSCQLSLLIQKCQNIDYKFYNSSQQPVLTKWIRYFTKCTLPAIFWNSKCITIEELKEVIRLREEGQNEEERMRKYVGDGKYDVMVLEEWGFENRELFKYIQEQAKKYPNLHITKIPDKQIRDRIQNQTGNKLPTTIPKITP